MVEHILKVEPIRFTDGFDVGQKEREESKMPPNISGEVTGE